MYQVARATAPDFKTGCRRALTPDTSFVDNDPVLPGTVFYYMNRSFSPFVGTWGEGSENRSRSLGLGCQSL